MVPAANKKTSQPGLRLMEPEQITYDLAPRGAQYGPGGSCNQVQLNGSGTALFMFIYGLKRNREWDGVHCLPCPLASREVRQWE